MAAWAKLTGKDQSADMALRAAGIKGVKAKQEVSKPNRPVRPEAAATKAAHFFFLNPPSRGASHDFFGYLRRRSYREGGGALP